MTTFGSFPSGQPLQFRGKGIGAHVVRYRVDVHEVDACAAIKRAIRTCDERDRRCPDPVARLDAECQTCDVQRASGAVYGNAVLCVHTRCNGLFKCRHLRALGEKIGPERLDDSFDIRLVNMLPSVRYHSARMPLTIGWLTLVRNFSNSVKISGAAHCSVSKVLRLDRLMSSGLVAESPESARRVALTMSSRNPNDFRSLRPKSSFDNL